MLWTPTARLPVLHEAVRGLPPSVPAGQPVIGLPLSVKVTVPVGLLPETVAVKVTLVPAVAGFGAPVSDVDEIVTPVAERTAAAASMMPAPHSDVLQPPPDGNARAVVCIFETTCAGVNDGLTDSISEAMPASWGVAMLVPMFP